MLMRARCKYTNVLTLRSNVITAGLLSDLNTEKDDLSTGVAVPFHKITHVEQL